MSAVDLALRLVRLGTVNPPGTDAVVAGLLELVVTDPDDDWVRDLVEIAGGPPQPRGLTYFTDAAAPASGNPPTAVCGPDEAAPAHRTDEGADAAAIEAAADAFAGVARRWWGV
jgi:acetylornithine deacetylase/succinyl-diaminopimelate desuccinylase-like protein